MQPIMPMKESKMARRMRKILVLGLTSSRNSGLLASMLVLIRKEATMRRAMLLLVLAATVWAGGASLEDRVREVLPRPDEEKWLRIPWRRDLLAACEEAEKEGRPLFLWVMDGDPLGCT